MRVNLDGMLLTCRRFVPGMQERSWGRVINVTSTTVGLVMNGFLAYVTSKAGIIGFTRALASEVGPSGITVNAVMPGLTRTEGTRGEEESGFMEEMAARQPIPRIVETDDLADVVVFLASDSSRMMTGQTLVVDGGIIRL
jgi:3-oxoacyl-[acyl-carrier protein] reductase/(S)-1-phenylethanol dehydrogenase